MTRRLLSPAQLELANAVVYYRAISIELADDFLIEAKKAFLRIQSFPESSRRISGNYRRCLMQRFPYGVIYLIEGEEIIIVSIMHLHRDPNCWKSNL